VHRIKPDALFVVDGSYLLYRSFYGLKPLHTSTGIPTQATYGFCRAIKKVLDDFKPSYITVVWDSKGGSFRQDILPEYKATRMAPPSDLFIQKEQIISFVNAIKMCQVSKVGYEGDDLIASLVKDHPDHQIILVCADKDMYQLLSDNVLIFDPFKNKLIDEITFTQERGFGPEKIPFFYSLLGDTSDNIPGVKGIGEKTAENLVKQFDSLDDLYNNLEKVEKDRIRTLLHDQKDQAYLSLKLFTLARIDLELSEKDIAYDKKNWLNAGQIFKQLEFTSMLKEIEKLSQKTSTNQMSLFGLPVIADTTSQKSSDQTGTLPGALAPVPWICTVIQTEEALDLLIEKIKTHKEFGLDTETTGTCPMLDRLVGISVAVDTEEGFYIPLAHLIGQQLDFEKTLQKLKPVLEDKDNKIYLHQAKFDELVLSNYDINVPHTSFDTILAANLIKNAWQKINLKDLSAFYLKEPMIKFKEIMGKTYKTFDQVPVDGAAQYGAHDALQTFKLKLVFEKELEKEPRLKKLFHDVEMPLAHVLFKMEKTGIMLDIEKINAIKIDVAKEFEQIEKKIFSAFEHKEIKNLEELNLNSPKQMEVLLFDELKLPVIKKSKTGHRSTDQEVLHELSKIHPIPGLILKHRELAKLKNTYLDPLPSYVSPKTGRIHTSFSQTMVATGRLSSMEPNLQNIPTSGTYGAAVRSAFIAPPGRLFLSADYSQIELRVLAFLSNDKNLIDLFMHDIDIHTKTASQLFDISIDQVTNEQRQFGKRINFSIIYGLTAYGLAQDLGIKPNEAKVYIEKYFAQYPDVARWMEHTVQEAMKTGYTETWLGFRRHVPELFEKNRMLFEAGKRIATNSPVQGTTSELMKMAMIQIDKAFTEQKIDAQLLLQIHDEIVVEFAEHERERVEKIVRDRMEHVVDWHIPLTVATRVGSDWGQISK